MKKILSRIFSATLMVAIAATPALAQTAKKVVSSDAKKNVAAVQAVKAPEKGKKGSILNQYQIRTKDNMSSNGLSQAQAKAGALKSEVKKVRANEVTSVPVMNGMIIYNEDQVDAGLYQLPTSATDVASPLVTGFSGYGGVCINGIYYATGYTKFWGYILSMDLYEVDVFGGEIVAQYELPSLDCVCTSMALDPTTGLVYAIGYNAEGSGIEFKTINLAGESTSVNVIATCDRNWNTIAFDKTGQLWGISYIGQNDSEGNYQVLSSTLCKIDKATGAVTEIGDTGLAPQYMSSGCIDPTTGHFFWNVCPADKTSHLVEVNLSTGEAIELYQYAAGGEIMGMYVPAPEAEDNAPAVCKNVNIAFENGSLNGVCTLTTPATFFDGTQGSGELYVIVLANGEQIGYAEPQWNQSVTIDLDMSLMGAGKYDFTVFASNEAGMGPRTQVKGVFVGADIPSATSASLEYVNGNMEVYWLPVTSSVNGGYINLDNLTYTVKDKDGNVKAEGLTVTEWSEAVAAPSSITSYQYQVEVVCDGMVSEPALTNTVVLGDVVPPYTSNYAENGLQGWTILNENGDSYSWEVYNGNLRMRWNSSLDMDDWAITMPIKLEKGKAYNFSCYTWSSASYEETLEIKYGTEPTVAGMTNTILEPTSVKVSADNRIAVENMIVPETTGTYYIGFHGISAADAFYLYVSDFTIGEGSSTAAPGLGVINVEGDPNGGLSATVNVTYPSLTMGGEALESITKAEISRDGTVIKTVENPAVGGTLSFTDALDVDGNYEYSLVCYNETGKGLVATASTFVGFDKPAAITLATIARTDTEGQVIISWNPVTTDVNGKTYPAGSVKYKVAQNNNGWVPFTDFLDGDSYTYQAVAAGEQDFVQYAVFPFYNGVNGTGAATDMIPVGTPYDGIDETFAEGTLSYIWGRSSAATEYGQGGGSVALCTGETFADINGVNDDNGYVNLKTSALDASVLFFSGMITLDQMVNPGFSFYVYNMSNGTDADINEINVYVKDLDNEEAGWVRVYNKPINEIAGATDATELGELGWNKLQIGLGEYANKTIQVGVEAVCKFYINNLVDNFKVGSILGHDLKANGITAPAKVKAGDSYEVSVKVSNEGAQTAEAYSVELYADETLVDTKEMTDLAPSAIETVVFEREMSAIATEPVVYFAKVVYAEDENELNNQTSDVTVNVVVSTLPVATDLEGASENGKVVLNWNEPNLEGGVAEPITEDFEDAEAFSATYGDWTFVDVDKSEVGGFQGTDLPGITPGETKGSFWIWDASQVGNQTFAAHSGDKYLFALFRYDDGTTDDWAISPELPGDAQTISFWAKSYSSSYPEKIQVYYSTGSLDTADFVAIDGTYVASVPADWTEYTADLPAGAKYFAIRSFATGSFMLMVDDVTYIPAEGGTSNLEIAGYNIYRDGVKINDALVEETTFTDDNVEADAEYTYVVTVVYTDKGESAASNEIVVKVVSGVNAIGEGALTIYAGNGSVVVLNADGLNVTVAGVNGAVVYNGAGEAKSVINVAPGVYVVKAGKAVKKVVVK